MRKARYELGLPESEESTMILEDRRVRNFLRLVAGIAGGLILLHALFKVISGIGYRYFFVDDVLLHWVLVAAGIGLISVAFASGSQK
jgi:hypothetical protein